MKTDMSGWWGLFVLSLWYSKAAVGIDLEHGGIIHACELCDLYLASNKAVLDGPLPYGDNYLMPYLAMFYLIIPLMSRQQF